MGQVSLQGTLSAGPGGVSSGFPGASAVVPLGLVAEPLSYSAATGILQFNLDSALAFAQLGGIDETIGPVKKSTVVYLRSPSEIRLRLTFDDGLGGEEVVEVNHRGLLVKEQWDDHALLKIEAKGVSLIEYFASGPS